MKIPYKKKLAANLFKEVCVECERRPTYIIPYAEFLNNIILYEKSNYSVFLFDL